MNEGNSPSAPQSPEVEPAEVRRELAQDQITHVGEPREPAAVAAADSGQHMGAVDGETTPVRSPMSGPDDVIEGDDDTTDLIDPADELTPG